MIAADRLFALLRTTPDDLARFRNEHLGYGSRVELEHLQRVREVLKGLAVALEQDDQLSWLLVQRLSSVLREWEASRAAEAAVKTAPSPITAPVISGEDLLDRLADGGAVVDEPTPPSGLIAEPLPDNSYSVRGTLPAADSGAVAPFAESRAELSERRARRGTDQPADGPTPPVGPAPSSRPPPPSGDTDPVRQLPGDSITPPIGPPPRPARADSITPPIGPPPARAEAPRPARADSITPPIGPPPVTAAVAEVPPALGDSLVGSPHPGPLAGPSSPYDGQSSSFIAPPPAPFASEGPSTQPAFTGVPIRPGTESPVRMPAGEAYAVAPAGPVPLMDMSIEHYATLCAKCVMYPDRVVQSYAEYGIRDESTRQELDKIWQDRFERDPTARRSYEKLYQRFCEYLQRHAR